MTDVFVVFFNIIEEFAETERLPIIKQTLRNTKSKQGLSSILFNCVLESDQRMNKNWDRGSKESDPFIEYKTHLDRQNLL